MVAADLGAAGSRVQAHLAPVAVFGGELFDGLDVARALGVQMGLPVQMSERGVVYALVDLLDHFMYLCHNFCFLSGGTGRLSPPYAQKSRSGFVYYGQFCAGFSHSYL